MKLFHTENGKEIVYVQMQDIMYLMHETDEPIPASIFSKVFKGVTIVTDENRFEFVKFEDRADVEFFKKLEFIIDFDQYKDLTDEELEKEAHKLIAKANAIAEEWNCMNEKKRKKNRNLYNEFNNLDYMINFLAEIYAVKHKKRIMPFPEFVEIKFE